MNFVEVNKQDLYRVLKNRKVRGMGRNQELICNFENSNFDIVEVVNYTHKNPKVCANTLRDSIKRLHKDGTIKVAFSEVDNKIYLYKVPIVTEKASF